MVSIENRVTDLVAILLAIETEGRIVFVEPDVFSTADCFESCFGVGTSTERRLAAGVDSWASSGSDCESEDTFINIAGEADCDVVDTSSLAHAGSLRKF